MYVCSDPVCRSYREYQQRGVFSPPPPPPSLTVCCVCCATTETLLCLQQAQEKADVAWDAAAKQLTIILGIIIRLFVNTMSGAAKNDEPRSMRETVQKRFLDDVIGSAAGGVLSRSACIYF